MWTTRLSLRRRELMGLRSTNHGGRQLDRAATPLELLPAVVDAVGDQLKVYLDGGVRSGADVAAAVALEPCHDYGRRHASWPGVNAAVDRLAELFKEDYARTLRLLGAPTTSDLDRNLVSLATYS